jgi:hypothetical protein
VTAGEHGAGLLQGGEPAVQNLLEDLAVELREGEADQVHSRQRPTAHGVDVGQRVDRSDAAEGERVVDDRREEIGGVDDGHVVRHPHHAGVVGELDADQQVVRLEPRQPAQDRVEQTLGELGAAAAVGAAPGQRGHLVGHDRVERARGPGVPAQPVHGLELEAQFGEGVGDGIGLVRSRLEHDAALGAHDPRRRHHVDVEAPVSGGPFHAYGPLDRSEDQEQVTF